MVTPARPAVVKAILRREALSRRDALRRKKPTLAIGIAFAVQEIDAVPITPRDVRLDLVLTEREVIDCREP